MKLPSCNRAVVHIEKLIDYCLNPEHVRGKHKARVFASALGVGMEHAEWLQSKLLEAAHNEEAQYLETNSFGDLYLVRFSLEGPVGQAMVRSLWLVRHGEDFPRLCSCYVE